MYDPYNSREARRAQRRYYRDQRRFYRYSNPMRGLAGGIVILALIIAFSVNGTWNGAFLPILFVGLAFCALFGSISSGNRQGIYGGFMGFIWLLGLALCFVIGFWPWILLPVAISIILGSLFNPIMAGLNSFAGPAQWQQAPPPPYQQPYQSQEQPGGYTPYQQGYPAAPPQATYQEGEQEHSYDNQPKQQYEQPQVQYPEQEQELPPMQQ